MSRGTRTVRLVSDKQSGAQALLAQMGGISGLIYSSLPVLVFVPVSSLFGLMPAIIAALAVAAVILVWRLVRKESTQPAISGFMGVGICALIAYLMGESKGYFLYGIWMSLFWAVVFLVSVLIRRPSWATSGAGSTGTTAAGAACAGAVLVFDIATITWVLVFASRFVVQRHLYDADETGWLGVARIAMGWPLTAVAALATYLAIRSAQRALHAHTPATAEDAEEASRGRGRGAGNLVGRRRAERTDRPLIAVAILASFVAFLDGSVVNLALPAISRDFGGGLALQQWVVDGYLLTLGALILVAGAISDAFGRLVVLRMGLVVFAVSSLLCAFAPSGWVLVAARCAAGCRRRVPGAELAGDDQRPASPGPQQARAIGTWTAWTGTAFVIGPLLGGVLVDALNWRWIFGVNIVPLVVTLYLTTKLSPEEFRSERQATIDVVGRGAHRGRPDRRRVRPHRAAAPRPVPSGGADQPGGRGRLPGRVPVVGAQDAESDDAAAHLLRTQFRRRQPRHACSSMPRCRWASAGGVVPSGDGGPVGHRGRPRHASDPGVVVLPRAVVRHPGGQARPAALHGSRPAGRGGRLPADGDASTAPFDFWTQLLPGLVVFGLGLSMTVSPLTAAILAAVDPAQSGIGSAINNAISRIAGLIAIAFTGVIIGGRNGFRRISAGRLCGRRHCSRVAGLISWAGIRNDECDYSRVSVEAAAGCHDRATPPPA